MNFQRSTFKKFESQVSGFIPPPFRRGFTLIELLLVIAIIGVVTAVSVPTFVKSIKGNRLRSAARSVIMAGRYAHSMCLLNQRELDLHFDLVNHTVAVGPAGGAGERDVSGLLEGETAPPPPAGAVPRDGASAGEGAGDPPAGAALVMRKLDEVKIAYVQIGGEDELGIGKGGRSDEVSAVVHYRSNGSCTPYSVRIEDDDGDGVIIHVDMLGGVETERD